MELKKILKNKNINKIKDSGYDDEQVNAIKEAMRFYPHLIDFVDPSYSISQINEVLEFFKHEDSSSIAYIFELEPSKRILMVQAYNKFANLDPKANLRTFRLVYDVAQEYDDAVLKIMIEKAITNNPDYEFLNTIKNAMDQNINLYDLKYFEELQLKNKEK